MLLIVIAVSQDDRRLGAPGFMTAKMAVEALPVN
jgi:hypothetical protein